MSAMIPKEVVEPLYIYGNSEVIGDLVPSIIKGSLPSSELDQMIFHPESKDWLEVVRVFGRSSPSFSSFRFICLQDVTSISDSDLVKLKELLDSVKDSKLKLLAYTEGPKPVSKLKDLFQEKGSVIFLDDPTKGSQRKKYAEKKLSGVSIQPEALERLMELVGDDFDSLCGEVRKLKVLGLGGDSITPKQVDLMFGSSEKISIFDFLDDVSSKDLSKSLNSLSVLMDDGVDPNFVFSMLVRRLRNLIRIKLDQDDAVKLNSLGVPKFVLGKMISFSDRFEVVALFKFLLKVPDYSMRMRSQAGVIEEMVAEICQE